jgi:hypothetical protein
MPASPGSRDVYFHIGLPKTGTSYIQQALFRGREKLAADGVLVPCDSVDDQTLAVWDFIGRRPRGAQLPTVVGAWAKALESIQRWNGDKVVFSHESLVAARPGQIRKLKRSLPDDRIHVVVTVRDLARTVVSSWQQELGKRRTWTWGQYISAVRNVDEGSASAGVSFWLRQDPLRAIKLWVDDLPPERVHVVILPPAGAQSDVLQQRFAAAVDIDPSLMRPERKAINTSVGVAGAEALRRLNLALEGALNERQYIRVVQTPVLRALRQMESDRKITLPAEHLDWATEWAADLSATLSECGYDVIGSLDDLVPSPVVASDAPDAVTEAELSEALLAAFTEQTKGFARMWWRVRGQDEVSDAGAMERLSSTGRSIAHGTRQRALDLADRNKLFARAARGYLKRASKLDD